MNSLQGAASRFQFGQTSWTKVFQAARPDGDTATQARGDLLVRYHDAVYRYLCARLGDSEAACELFSRFAERVVDLHPFLVRANPEKGRFRDYLKAILSRMVIDYHRENQRERKRRRPLLEGDEPAAATEDAGDGEFREVWRQELMNHAWKELEQLEKSGGQPHYTLLLHKAQNPKARSEAMAEQFTKSLARPLSAANVRQLLHRGQELLSDLFIAEVARSLREKSDQPIAAADIEAELIELDLFDSHRKAALERYRG